MPKKRSRAGFSWKQEIGGVPVWGIAVAIVAMFGMLAVPAVVSATTPAAAPYVRPSDAFATPTPTPTAVPDAVVSVIGDSYTAGSAENIGNRVWPVLLPADLHVEVTSLAVGGVGYSRGDADSFPSQASRVLPDSNLVVIFGSRNDIDADPAAVYDGAFQTIATVRATAPAATIVIIGSPWVDTNPPENVLAVRDAVASAAADSGVPFVDALAEGWISGGGLIGGDGVHPNDAGHDVLAERMAEVIRTNLPAV